MVGRFSVSAYVSVAVMLMFAPCASAGMRSLDRMMADLGPESAQSAETIRRVYQDHLDVLTLREYDELAGALDNGGLVPLPANPIRYNILPRLDGPHPIGEMDLANQNSYTSARAATIGLLLEIASRVKTGPVEVTSLVRHADYQEELRSSNANAITSVPMHTMGLAVDIGLINTRLETIYEIRDVLQKMQNPGDILFIGERRQLVFHVVPQPSRLGYFNEVYFREVGAPRTSRSAEAMACLDAPRLAPTHLNPQVTTEIVAMFPAEGAIENLWVGEPATVTPAAATGWMVRLWAFAANARGYWHLASAARWLALLFMACASTWLLISRPRTPATLFER